MGQLNNCLKYLKNVNEQVEENPNISQYEREKINAQLAYEKKVEDIEGYKYAVNALITADQATLGKPVETKEGLFDICKNNIYKYQTDQYEKVTTKIKEAMENNGNFDVNILSKEEQEILEDAKLNKELLQLYNISNEKKTFDAELSEEKKKEKNRTLLKIAALKRSIFNEQIKNAYKKKIKSKGYRKYIRNKNIDINQKILNKLKNHYPDMSEYLEKCEEEYAKMRNAGKGEKSQKILKTLKRFKNDALKKAVLKNIQEDREEKYALKEMIKKAQNFNSSDEDAKDENEFEYEEEEEKEKEDVDDDDEKISNEEEDVIDENNRGENSKQIDIELKKRNLLKYKFIHKGRELKKEEEKGLERLKLVTGKLRKNSKENIYNSDLSDFSYISNENNDTFKKGKNMLENYPHFTEEALQKKKNQLIQNPAFMNMLKKSGILDTNILLEDDEEITKWEGKEETNKTKDVKAEEKTSALSNEEKDVKEKKNELQNICEITQKEDEQKESVTNTCIPENIVNDVVIDTELMDEVTEATLEFKSLDEEETNEKKNEENTVTKTEKTLEEDENNNKNFVTSLQANTETVADINAIEGEYFLKKFTSGTNVYNFENNVYEKYINIDDEEEIKKEKEKEIELSDSEKVNYSDIKMSEWTNINTLIENEKKQKLKEQEIIEKKKNIPLHTVITNDKPDKLFAKYYVDTIPHTQVEEEYEKGLNLMISKELNYPKCFKNLIAPKITTRYGQIIEPLQKSLKKLVNILKTNKNKRKTNL